MAAPAGFLSFSNLPKPIASCRYHSVFPAKRGKSRAHGMVTSLGSGVRRVITLVRDQLGKEAGLEETGSEFVITLPRKIALNIEYRRVEPRIDDQIIWKTV